MAEPRACLELYRQPDKNSSVLEKGKSYRGLDLDGTMGMARRLPSTTSEITLQFQMYVLEHYHAVDKNVEILSVGVFSYNIS